MKSHIDSYAEFLSGKLDIRRKFRVVADCSNGTAGSVFGKLKDEGGNLEVILINERPDGNFPAHGPNPLLPGAMTELEKRVRKEDADLGIAFDADGDRVFFIDNLGRPIDANEAGYILAQVFQPPFVVSEIASWRLKKMDGASASRVGHYFFKNLMRERNASLGLEHSGHFYFRDFYYCDSGILAAVEVMNFSSSLETGLSSWLDSLPPYHRSGEINFSAQGGPASGWKEDILDKIENKYRGKASRISRLDGLTLEFNLQDGGEYWINVRASNTENLLRLNVEAFSPEILKSVTDEISGLISGK